MIFTSRRIKIATAALLFGALIPFAWIVTTGEFRISETKTVEDHAMTHTEYEEFMAKNSRPMTLRERVGAAAFIVKKSWRVYLNVSAVAALILFAVFTYIWPASSNEP